MKKLVLSVVIAIACTGVAQAQHLFGYFSYDAVLKAMPEYTTAQQSLTELKEKYRAETKRVEADFNSKYEEFLEGQKEFPAIILQKRQTELQERMEKNITFKREARKLYNQAEKEALDAIKTKVFDAVKAIGKERKLAFILNTDSESCPWIDPSQGMDITNEIFKKLN